MSKSRMSKIQEMHNLNGEKEIVKEIKGKIVNQMAKKGYRADLRLLTASKSISGSFAAEVKFNKSLGHPSEKDLLSLVAQSYPNHEIDWSTVELDTDSGVIVLQLEPALQVVPVASIKEIPAEFHSIGSGIYKRAADASGNVQEIWQLKKQDDGTLALTRNQQDLEVTAEAEDQFKAGDVVQTPNGPGRLVRFDDLGNAFVQVGSKKHLVAATELQPYDINKEKQKLVDYFTQVYGAEYAKELVKDYDTTPGKKL